MKKVFIIISLLCASLGTRIKAQDTSKTASSKYPFHVVELGVRFMPTFSSFDLQTSSEGTVKGQVTLGYGAGALLGINFTSHVGIEGEVIYNTLSQKYKNQNAQQEITIRYLNIPLLLSLNTGKSKPVNLNLVLGPQLGFTLGSNVTATGNSSSDSVITVWAVKKNDFGFAYGAGLQFSLNSSRTIRLDVGFRGVYGFVNISNNDPTTKVNSYSIDRASVRTRSGYLGILFSF